MINSVLWVKLCTIFSAILDAAAVAENWIVIDRTAAKSPAADLLIEAAMSQTPSRPPILVIDALTRLQNFKGPTGSGALAEATKANIEKLEAIKAGLRPWQVERPLRSSMRRRHVRCARGCGVGAGRAKGEHLSYLSVPTTLYPA